MSSVSLKVSDAGKDFLKKFAKNRYTHDIDEKELSHEKALEVIAKYFKLNNDRYVELVKFPRGKNV